MSNEVPTKKIDGNKRVKTIHEIMGLEPEYFTIAPEMIGQEEKPQGLKAPPPPGLSGNIPVPPPPQEAESKAVQAPELADLEGISYQESPPGRAILRKVFSRDFIRYPIIFVVALVFFYVILNFKAVTTQIGGFFTKAAPKVVQSQQVPADFSLWLHKYYVFTNESQILAPSADPDNDGLTNIEEYYLGTNPLRYDTDNDGFGDGQEVLDGFNPLYSGKLTSIEQKTLADHININDLESRVNLQGSRRVAGEETQNVQPAQTTQTAQSDFIVDVTKPGNINIPKIGVNAPVIWNRDFSKIEDDLKYGTAHHPATPFPGEKGTVSIHGHSSGNPGDGSYQTVFTKLDFLVAGDDVFVTVYNASGQSRRYLYVVRSAKVYAKTDPAQFADLGGYNLNLSTSWPIGTALQRYVVTTDLVGVN